MCISFNLKRSTHNILKVILLLSAGRDVTTGQLIGAKVTIKLASHRSCVTYSCTIQLRAKLPKKGDVHPPSTLYFYLMP